MTPKFAIGSNVQFGDEGWWKVIRYHVVGAHWEIMFRSITSGVHRSVPLSQLESWL